MAVPARPRSTRMLERLARWTTRGWLREVDHAFAGFLAQESPDAHPLLILAAALASCQLGRGHVCLDLRALHALSWTVQARKGGHGEADEDADAAPAALLARIDPVAWLAALQHPELVGTGAGNTPLVLADTRLYLRRYWQHEQAVREGIAARVAQGDEVRATLPADAVRAALDVLFPARSEAHTDWQKLACALAVGNPFCIVTGGPGTGKTTTVVKLLALLQGIALQGDAGPPQVSLHPLGGPGVSQGWGLRKGGAGPPQVSLHPLGGPGVSQGWGLRNRPLRIRLAAPTGKAAARLNESIAGAVRSLPLDAWPQGEQVRARIPTQVTTLHRLLGSRPGTRRLRHHAGNRLALDVLVVDEASMVDLEMMTALLDALPEQARLVLLGDRDQLASVEAGAVLGALCARAREGHYTARTCDWLAAVTGEVVPEALRDESGEALDQAIVMLRHSHRFSAEGGIGQLAEAVNAGDVAAVRAVWGAGHADIARIQVPAPQDAAHEAAGLRALVIDGAPEAFAIERPQLGQSAAPPRGNEETWGGPAFPQESGSGAQRPLGYGHYLRLMAAQRPDIDADAAAFDDWARGVLAARGRFQLLCALRRGPWGVEGLNQRVARVLRAERLITRAEGWYAGRPVLVTRNEHGLGLMNGDMGLALELPGTDASGVRQWVLRVAFAAGDGGPGIRWISPSRLSAVETVFALTVHKAQGSEFAHAAFVLPERSSPALTRELLYTGITRARRWFTLALGGTGWQVLDDTVRRRVWRASGLRSRG